MGTELAVEASNKHKIMIERELKICIVRFFFKWVILFLSSIGMGGEKKNPAHMSKKQSMLCAADTRAKSLCARPLWPWLQATFAPFS